MVSPIRTDIVAQPPGQATAPVRSRDAGFANLLVSRTQAAARTQRGSGTLVEARKTPLSGEQAAAALSQAYTELTGERPSAATTAILTSQWAHETAHGASMYNYNFGGIKGTGPSGLTVAQRTKEGYGDTERQITDRFRAYSSAREGAVDYVRLLKNNYPKAVEAARRGDAEGFVHALKARGYFTGEEAAYVRSVSSLSHQALTRGFAALGSKSGPESGAVTASSQVSEGVAAGELSQAELDARILASGAEAPAANNPTPFIDALRISDEISRAALRIATEDRRRSET